MSHDQLMTMARQRIEELDAEAALYRTTILELLEDKRRLLTEQIQLHDLVLRLLREKSELQTKLEDRLRTELASRRAR